ncbi:MAG: Crp/Fnr family transcriptional regulator [Bacteroidales bacterium]|nr:Crp/Fnr family transcriptional regulator [Bacteroidales bacterium]
MHARTCDFKVKIRKLFSYLTEEELEYLNENHNCINLKKNEIIYHEGERPSGLICLSEGKVKVYKEGIGGREQIIRLAKPVGFIGYRALLADEEYRASSMTLEPSTIMIIQKDPFFEVLKNNSSLSLQIIKYLATELGFSNSRCVTLTQKHVRGRLAEALLVLIDTYGFEDDNVTIKAYLSREDIASLSNMTNSNAIRTLRQFEEENILKVEKRKIKIFNYKKLEKISDLG